MDYELNKASRRLSELPISIELSGCIIEVQWLRVMQKTGRWEIPRHAHSSFEFHIIARGCCRVVTDTHSFIAGEGCMYLTGPKVHHEQHSYDEKDLIEYSLDCTFRPRKETSNHDRGEWEQLQAFFLHAPCLPVQDTSGLISLFEQALEEALHTRPAYGILIHSYVVSMLVAAARNMGLGPTLANGNQKTRMDRIAEFVQDNIHRPLCPMDIAAYLNLSEKQISRIVFASEGFSTKRFITIAKIEEAKKLLKNPSFSISDIAQGLGYTSTSYFTNVFRKHQGIAPGAYREKIMPKLDIHHT